MTYVLYRREIFNTVTTRILTLGVGSSMEKHRNTRKFPVVNASKSIELGSNNRSLKIERKKPVTLIMLSGGVDSTYQLVKFLRETDDDIVVHHVHIINAERRHVVEAQRCELIVNFCCQKYRRVFYAQTAVDRRGMPFFGFDMVTIGFEAGIAAHSYFLAHGRPVTRWVAGSCEEEGGNPDRLPHVINAVAANCFPTQPPVMHRPEPIRKVDEFRYLDPELRSLVWTCRTPVWTDNGFTECGVCHTCKLMTEVKREYSARPT